MLPIAEFTHNSWKHEHTKHTPHELIIGINPTASLTIPEDPVPAAQDRLKELIQSRTDAQKALERRIKPLIPMHTFISGDKVWLDVCNLKTNNPSKKLSPQRLEPFWILQQVTPVTYHIKVPQTWKIHNVFHVDLLIPHHETQAYGEMHSQPPPELIDGEEEYKVEEIIGDRTFR